MSFSIDPLQKGFTLIEMIVVMAIIMVLSVVSLSRFEIGGDQLTAKRAVYQLAQDFREAEEIAVSAQELSGSVPEGGYGIYMIQGDNHYILFADINGDYIYTAGVDSIVRRMDIEKPTFIESINPGSPLNIVFVPPDPEVMISPVPTGGIVTVTLNFKGITKSITINDVGLIKVVD